MPDRVSSLPCHVCLRSACKDRAGRLYNLAILMRSGEVIEHTCNRRKANCLYRRRRAPPGKSPTGSGNGSSARSIAMSALTRTSTDGRGFPNMVSWVVPTSLAVLSLKQLPCTCGGLEQVPLRIGCGVQMLVDRACPGGGWIASCEDDASAAQPPDGSCLRASSDWISRRSTHPFVTVVLLVRNHFAVKRARQGGIARDGS